MISNIRMSQHIHIGKQDPSNIECNIALADNHRIFSCQIGFQFSMLRQTVVPSYKGSGRMYAVESGLAWDAQLFVFRCPVREKNGIVVRLQCR